MKVSVGIDGGKTTYHACAIDGDGEFCWPQMVANDQAATEQLIAPAAATGTELRWAADLTSSVAALLLTAGQRVVDAPGWVVNRMSGVFRGTAKSMHRARRGLARDIDKLIRDRFRSHPQVEIIAPLLALASSLVDVLWMLLRDGRTFVPATPTPITSAA